MLPNMALEMEFPSEVGLNVILLNMVSEVKLDRIFPNMALENRISFRGKAEKNHHNYP